ncbi:MAG: hypothetical protein ACF8MF_03090 [Phycisphaerales bacterium JB052]
MDAQLQQRLMLYAGLIPGAISFTLLLAAWYLHALRDSRTDLDDADSPRTTSQGPRWLLPMLIAVGVAGAEYAQNDTFLLWPDDNTYRYTHAALLIALAATAEGLVRFPLFVAIALRLFAYAGAFLMLTEGYADTVMGGSANLIAYTLFAAITATLVATAADQNAQLNQHQRPLGWLDAITWCLILAATMPVLLANHFALGAMYPAGPISVLVAATLVGLIFRHLSLARGSITMLVGFFMTMLIGSLVQTGADNLPSILLAATLPLVTLIPTRTDSRTKRLLTRVVLIALIAGAAMTTIHAPNLSFWPGNDASDQQSTDDESIEDYYNNLE